MKTFADIAKIRADRQAAIKAQKEVRIAVGLASCGIASGAKKVFDALVAAKKPGVLVEQTGCAGLCKLEPIVEVYIPGGKRITYARVKESDVKRILDAAVAGKVLDDLLIEKGSTNLFEYNFIKKQQRIALKNCGHIDPTSIEDYIAVDGYKGLELALTKYDGQKVVDIIKDSGLRGRGGGGFSTGMKWQFALNEKNEKKYVLCNADEGDPGAFMDRAVIESDPFALIEAMTIAGIAIGADEGFVYCRAEYPLAVTRLYESIAIAKKYNLLGENIMGSGKNFDLDVRLGAGAFVCGEETALIASIEAQRGEPRPRPPFPAVKGLFGKPTLLNNVETYANIPLIIREGATVLNKMGTERSKGTKVFALGGKINNTGLVEVAMGTKMRDVVMDIGGGIPGGKKFKAAQTGGPSGGCIPAEHFDVAIDYDNLVALGSMMGSGGLIVVDEDNCMVALAKFFLDFTCEESCGKCTPCRIGNKRLLELLEKITSGNGEVEDLTKLEELSYYIKENSLCGLGQSSPNPILSTLRYFRNEYEAHVIDKKCPAGVCQDLARYTIGKDCIGCTACTKVCPVGAIAGAAKQLHVIDPAKCIKCGACASKCPKKAISKS